MQRTSYLVNWNVQNRSRFWLVTLTACLTLTTAPSWGLGLAGDQIRGTLILPWAPEAGNWFSLGPGGSPISANPTSALVGTGIEFAYTPYPADATAFWTVTADVSDSQIRITERYSDSNPGSIWLVEMSGWTLTLGDLDWAGATGISSVTIVAQDPAITLLGFDSHSVRFNIDGVTLYPTGPYSYSRTTVVQLTAIPEPSAGTLLLFSGILALLGKAGSARASGFDRHAKRNHPQS